MLTSSIAAPSEGTSLHSLDSFMFAAFGAVLSCFADVDLLTRPCSIQRVYAYPPSGENLADKELPDIHRPSGHREMGLMSLNNLVEGP
jgi:hypothetical protein